MTEQETAVQDLRATLASDAACIQSQQRSLQDTLQTVNTLRAHVAELEKALCERESELQKLSKQLVESNAALAVFQSSQESMDAEEVFYSASEGEEEEENPEEAGDFALNLPQEYNFGEPIVLRLCMEENMEAIDRLQNILRR